jgi:DNA-binding IclR family transcriptional regulator
MILSKQQQTVLDYLQRSGHASQSDISMSTLIPVASVRRTVRELRSLGYEVSYGDGSRDSVYRYHGVKVS